MTLSGGALKIPAGPGVLAPLTASLQKVSQPFYSSTDILLPNPSPPIDWVRELKTISCSMVLGFIAESKGQIARVITPDFSEETARTVIAFLEFRGKTSSPLQMRFTAKQVQEVLELPGFLGSGNVSVSGPIGGPWTILTEGALTNAAAAEITIKVIEGSAGGENQTVSAVPAPPEKLNLAWQILLGGLPVLSVPVTFELDNVTAGGIEGLYQQVIPVDQFNPIEIEHGAVLRWRIVGRLPQQEGKVGGAKVQAVLSSRIEVNGESAGPVPAEDSAIGYTDEDQRGSP